MHLPLIMHLLLHLPFDTLPCCPTLMTPFLTIWGGCHAEVMLLLLVTFQTCCYEGPSEPCKHVTENLFCLQIALDEQEAAAQQGALPTGGQPNAADQKVQTTPAEPSVPTLQQTAANMSSQQASQLASQMGSISDASEQGSVDGAAQGIKDRDEAGPKLSSMSKQNASSVQERIAPGRGSADTDRAFDATDAGEADDVTKVVKAADQQDNLPDTAANASKPSGTQEAGTATSGRSAGQGSASAPPGSKTKGLRQSVSKTVLRTQGDAEAQSVSSSGSDGTGTGNALTPGIGSDRGSGSSISVSKEEEQVAARAALRDLANTAADAMKLKGQRALPLSKKKLPAPGYAVRKSATAQQEVKGRRGKLSDAGALSSRSIDGDDDGMLDRFGTVDIVTGKPVRDLKTDPVRQLVQWRETFFRSKDSVAESLDSTESSDPTN